MSELRASLIKKLAKLDEKIKSAKAEKDSEWLSALYDMRETVEKRLDEVEGNQE